MRWSYKTIHYELKKEGLLGSAFLDEPEIELSLNQYGKAGWELVSLLETRDGLVAVFKQPLDLDTRPFSAVSKPSERIDRVLKVSERRTNTFKTKPDVAEAVLLDEFEVIEEKDDKEDDESKNGAHRAKQGPAKPAILPVDVGLIRIE